MSPAMAAARNAGPPIAGGNVSIEGAGAFIAVTFAGAGGGEVAGIGRAGSEPVESAFGHCDGDRGAAGAGAGVPLGTALGLALGAAGGGVRLNGGAAMGCAAGASVAAGSTFCLPPALPPGATLGPALGTALGTALGATFGTTLGAVFGAALGTGATSGVGPVVAGGDGSAPPKGCGDPLCGCAAVGVFCGGAVGCAGLCHGAGASPAGGLS